MPRFGPTLLALLVISVIAACSSTPQHPSRVSMHGSANFRDVGGYETVDGKHVKWGVLFRSDDLPDLSTLDVRRFERLGIRTVYDLRHDYEKTKNPSRLPDGDQVQVVEIPVYYPPLDRRESRRKILSAKVDEGHFRELMIDANRAFALDYLDQVSGLLRSLAAADTRPAVIHCTDGKDRTGFAIAVILSAVGVPRETIYEDYLLSNVFLESKNKRNAFLAWLGSLFRVPRDEVRYLLDVRREYLEAAFAAIDEEYGSFDAYLREGLNINEPTLDRLREALTA